MNFEQIPNNGSMATELAKQLFEHQTSPEQALAASKVLGSVAVLYNQGIFEDPDKAYDFISKLKS